MITFTGEAAANYKTVVIHRQSNGESRLDHEKSNSSNTTTTTSTTTSSSSTSSTSSSTTSSSNTSTSNTSSGKPKRVLEYFALRGLGELPRLLLEYYDLEYTNIYYFSNDTSWNQRKPSSTLGYMPIYSDEHVTGLAESGAICRHIVRAHGGLNPPGFADMAKADMLFEATRSIPGVVNGWRIEWKDDMSRTINYLQRLLPFVQSCTERHNVDSQNNRYNLGELSLFMVLQTFHEARPSFLTSTQGLSATFSAFRGEAAAHPNIAMYLKSDRRIPMAIKEQGETGWKERSNAVAPGSNGYAFLKPLPKSFEESQKFSDFKKKRKR